MFLVIILDFIVLVTLCSVALRKGFEHALPAAAFFLVLAPEESKLPLPGLFDITTQRVVILTMIVLYIILKGGAAAGRAKLPMKWALIVMCMWWTMSTIGSIAVTDSLKGLLSLVLDYILVYCIFAKSISSTEMVKKILLGIVSAVIVCSVFGMFEAYADWSVISLFPSMQHRFSASGGLYVDQARGVRVQSTFGHPILFGSALAMTIPMALYFASIAERRAQKWLLWCGILLMFACIFKTSSRGPWLALGLSFVPVVIYGGAKIRRYVATIVLLAIIVVVVRPGVLETLWNDYVSTTDSHSYQGESYQYRYVLYGLVIQELDADIAHALLGYGPQSFPSLHLVGVINGRTMAFASCDSSFAALLIETGYVGFVIVVGILGMGLLRAISTFRSLSPPDNQVCLMCSVTLGAFYFEMTNVAIFGWGQQTVILWIVLAIVMVYSEVVDKELSEESDLITEQADELNSDMLLSD